MSDFKGRRFPIDLILLCVRWYCKFGISYRDLEEMMSERGGAGDFDAELKEQIADEEVRRRLRRQLPSNIFVQFLAGSREVRTGVLGFLLRLIAQISLGCESWTRDGLTVKMATWNPGSLNA
jgi:hypothetical protein